MSKRHGAVRSERGAALGVAIFALVVIGALVAGALFVGVQEQQVGRNTIRMDQAFAAAQQGAQLQVANWFEGHPYNNLVVGDSATFNAKLADSTGWYRGSVRKLANTLYLVRSEGFSADDRTRQQVGLLVRLRVFELAIRSAFKTAGATELAGNSLISGNDSVPPNWNHCPPRDTVAGVAMMETDSLSFQGNNHSQLGDPPIKEDSTISDSSMSMFGDVSWDEITSMATVTAPTSSDVTPYKVFPTLAGGVCDKSNPKNWGEPWSGFGTVPECRDYFPIIRVNGNLALNGERGQGVLIVEGDLLVQGKFEFYGPVLVKGKVVAQGGGANVPHFFGGIIARNLTGTGNNRFAGNAKAFFSSCSILKALEKHAPGFALRERSWVQLY